MLVYPLTHFCRLLTSHYNWRQYYPFFLRKKDDELFLFTFLRSHKSVRHVKSTNMNMTLVYISITKLPSMSKVVVTRLFNFCISGQYMYEMHVLPSCNVSMCINKNKNETTNYSHLQINGHAQLSK